MKQQKMMNFRKIMMALLFFIGMMCLQAEEVKAAVTVDDVVYMTYEDTKTAKINNILVVKEHMVFPDTITVEGETYIVDGFYNEDLKNETTLKTVKLPNGMKSLAWQLFYGCTSLESVTLPSGLTTVSASAFSGCSSLTRIELPDTVTTISTTAFMESGLTEIEIPSGVSVINSYTFKNCENLTSVKLPDSLTGVNEEAFMGCSDLEKIELPSSVTTIGGRAFSGCSKLRTIVIPPQVTAENFGAGDGTKEDGMFYGASKLATVYYPATLKSEMSDAVTSNTATSQISYVVNDNKTVSLTVDVLGTNVDSITLPESIYGMQIVSANANGEEVTFVCSKHYNTSGYSNDESNHWLGECAVCGESKSEPHSFKGGSAACVCGYIPFAIENQPMGGALTYGYSAGTQLTVAVKKTLGKEDITYQWQENGKDISGATTNPYNIPTGKYAGTYTYRCKVTCGGYSVFSKEVVVTVGKSAAPAVKPESSMTVPYTTVKVGDVTLPTGWSWQESDKAKALVVDSAVTATALYHGADKGNYEKESMVISITRNACVHEWDDGVITKKATSSKKGVRTYTCKICKETKTEKFAAPAKGKKYADDKNAAMYSVTKAGTGGGTVTYVKPLSQKADVTIPATVTIRGTKFKVTAIAKNAFKGSKKLKKVTIGKNIAKIGEKAFYNCKKLKDITIKTTKLTNKNVGKNAFKGISSTAQIKVPKSKYKNYKSMLKKKGVSAKAKIKK